MAIISDIIGTAKTASESFKQVIGRPHTYLESADPSDGTGVGRTFARHMLPSAPLVSIRPGKVAFSESLTDALNNAKKALGIDPNQQLFASPGASDAGTFFDRNRRFGVTSEESKAIEAAINDKKRGTVQDFVDGNSGSLRYFEFEPQIQDYMSVFATLSSRMFSRIRGAPAPWDKFDQGTLNTMYGGFFTFWAENATSVSESASADVGATALAGMVKSVSDLSRQGQYLLADGAQNDMLTQALQGVADKVGGDNPAGLRASLGGAILGMNPMFPDVWKDSTFSRSYNVSFKFHSPYGHPAAIYQNVINPFLMLLALVLPVSRGPSMYSTPFVFQMDCPGYFACDLGVCTGFDFVKGGSENLWTDTGLPRQISVTMQVRDLYPVLTSSPNSQSLYLNVGMGTFLDNLATIRLNESTGHKDVIQQLKANTYRALQQGAGAYSAATSATQRFFTQTGITGFADGAANTITGLFK